MKWVRIGKSFFNTDLIQAFYWALGKLWVHHMGDPDPEGYADPNKEKYYRLCLAVGMAPVEEDDYGEK